MAVSVVPPGVVALQREQLRHDALMTELRLAEATGQLKTFEDGLAICAAYAEVALHGTYTGDAIGDICQKVADRLAEKRTIILS